ncbi:MAG: site-2 protease family protein [Chroococcales cyanobacterium]
MQSSWQIGSLFGIPLYIDSSWLFILLLVTLVNATDVSLAEVSSPLGGWIVGFIMALLLFTSVLLHELGHSLVAKAQGIPVNSITLFLFGGVASIERESKTPGQAFQVAIAGPAVSFTLFALFSLLTQFWGESSLLGFITLDLARINLVLGLFNLIPGLPLDGGQVFKAAVWKITGNRFTAVRWAAATGKAIGTLGIILALVGVLLTGEVGAIWIALIGWFILRNADAYDRITRLQEVLMQLTAADAMTRDYRVVNANLTLREFADEYILTNSGTAMPLFAASEGRYRGQINVRDLQLIERSQWDFQTLQDIAHPLTSIPHVEEKTSLVEVIEQLETIDEPRLTVLSPAGAVAGVIDRGDIVKAIASKYNLRIPDSEIKRVKLEGTYPQNLPLAAIAKSIEN